MKINSVILIALSFLTLNTDAQKTKPKKFIDPANMDMTVKPGDNFFQYANGNWMKQNPIPPSKIRWGSFGIIAEENSKRLKTLLEDAAHDPSLDPKFKKVADLYISGMDTVTIEKMGIQPIRADLDRINAIQNLNDLLNEMALERVNGTGGGLIGMGVQQDLKNATKYIAYLGQFGTSLPDRDNYLKNDARSLSIRKAYLTYVSKLFQLSGTTATDADKNAQTVLRIETALAKAQLPRAEMRDRQKTYNKFSYKDLSSTSPLIDWKVLATKMMITGPDSVVVSNPAYIKSVDMLLGIVPVDDWKVYLQARFLQSSAPFLNSAFVNENFKYTQVLTGQKEISPRWQRVADQIDDKMGDLLGELYVKKYFTPEAKKRMLDLVNNLQQTFSERIKRLDWMSEATKQQALDKLFAFTKKIGYTDKWRDYSSVTIQNNDYIGNLTRASKWAYTDQVERMGKPVDKTRWGFTPPTVNASYNSTNNEITFPAGILQFPFFDFDADDAVNYGGIGVVIGHEMTHGFDDQGRQSGADGNLRDWWTKEDADKFKGRAEQVANQYSALTMLDTLHVNGKLTLGENLADLGGMNIAYEALTKTQQFKEGKKIDGFTPAQRFFLGFAQVWRENITPEDAANRILTDPHSPAVHRVNAPITNIDAWYDAFNVKEGDKLYKAPDMRIRIW